MWREIATSNQPSAPGREGEADGRTKGGLIPGHISTKGFELSISN